MGLGPMTGRGAGYCAGYSVPGYMNPVSGGGRGWFGRGGGAFRGGGRGWRNWYYATGLPGWARAGQGLPAWGMPYYPGYAPPASPMTSEQELDFLKQQAKDWGDAMGELNKRIAELEAKVEEKG